MNLKRKLLRREATRDVRHRDLVGIHAIYARMTAALLSILALVALRVQIAAEDIAVASALLILTVVGFGCAGAERESENCAVAYGIRISIGGSARGQHGGPKAFFREGEAGRYNEGAKDKARRMR
jgi:hypothetical protein